jgi:hypothetical protein
MPTTRLKREPMTKARVRVFDRASIMRFSLIAIDLKTTRVSLTKESRKIRKRTRRKAKRKTKIDVMIETLTMGRIRHLLEMSTQLI